MIQLIGAIVLIFIWALCCLGGSNAIDVPPTKEPKDHRKGEH